MTSRPVTATTRRGATSAAANVFAALAYSLAKGPDRVREVAAEVRTITVDSQTKSAPEVRLRVMAGRARLLYEEPRPRPRPAGAVEYAEIVAKEGK